MTTAAPHPEDPSTVDPVAELFDHAAELPVEERAAYLDRAAPSPEIRAEVEELLRYDEETTPFLTTPAFAAAAGLLSSDLQPAEGTRIGNYRVCRTLGAGGMGTVYLAERDDRQFDQRVAIKVIHSGLASADLRALFRQERQILANLEHPGIARLIDGGELVDGRPYLVMEHVAGRPVDEFCLEQGLDPRAKLRLFVDICDIVQAAHSRLVIHQDLKPSNILVGADGRPKLVDFGTAELLRSETRPAATGPPEHRGPTFLTPAYSSPEQKAGGPITTATDIYSLGLILRELALGRKTQPSFSHLPDGLPKDLAAVVQKACAEQPEDRYTTVGRLAADVEAFLDRRPIEARPHSAVERGWTAVRRHPLAASAALLAALAVTSFVVTLERQQHRTEAALHRAERAGDLLIDLFAVADPESRDGRPLTADDLLDRGHRLLDDRDLDDPLRLHMVNGLVKRRLKLGQYVEAQELLSSVEELAESHPGREALETQALMGRVALRSGSWDEAERRLEQTLAKLVDSTDRRLQARVLTDLMEAHSRAGRFDQAVEFLTRLRPFSEERENGLEERDPELGRLHSIFGYYYSHVGPLSEAERHHQRAVELAERRGGRRHPDVADALGDLSLIYQRTGRTDEALATAEEAFQIQVDLLSTDHPQIAVAYHNLGTLYLNHGRFLRARELLEKAVDRSDQLSTFNSLAPVRSRRFLALAHLLLGSLESADRWGRSALDLQRRLGGGPPVGEADSRLILAHANALRGNWPEARKLYEEAVEICKGIDETTRTCGQVFGFFTLDLIVRGQVDEAEFHWLTWTDRVPGDGSTSPMVALSQAGIDLALGRVDQAAQRLSTAEKFLPQDRDHPWWPDWHSVDALVALARNDLDHAAQTAERGLNVAEQQAGDRSSITARSRQTSAIVAIRLGQTDRARELLDQAIAVLPEGADRPFDGGAGARETAKNLNLF